MRHKLLYILFIVLLNTVAQPAQASFFVKRQSSVVNVINPVAGQTSITTNNANEQVLHIAPPPFRSFASRGWVGILAVILGILGFVAPIFSVGAVLFGFLGIGGRRFGRHGYGYYGDGTDQFLKIRNRANNNKGLAIAGMVLGLTVIMLSIFFGFTGWGLF